MNCDTYQDLVAAHVDHALMPVELAEVQAHLRVCEQCQRLFEEESRFHVAFSARKHVVPVPVDVERRLHRALEAEGEVRRSFWERVGTWFGAMPVFPRLAFGLAVIGVFLVMLLPHIFRSAPAPDVFAHAVHYYQTVTEGVLPIEYTMEDPQGLQAKFNMSGRLDFSTKVSDLRPAGYRLKGGSVTTDVGQPLAVALYEGDDEESIVCLRQRGLLPPLPQGTKGENGHYWYTSHGYTAMFTQFSDHFCIMISRQPEAIFLQRLAMVTGSENVP
jgi:anti-sigma factor RsiW